MSVNKHPTLNLAALVVVAIFNAFFYASMEWLFFVTKSSALSRLSLFEKTRVLFVTGGALSILTILTLALLLIPVFLAKNGMSLRLAYLACLPPAFVASVNALLLFDNFTYTLFKFGVVTAEDNWRIPYFLGFTFFLLWVSRQTHDRIYKRRKPATYFALSLLSISLVAIITVNIPHVRSVSAAGKDSSSERDYPDILVIGGDGLSASYLSAYGYSEETTPFLNQLAAEALVAENAFPNVSSTTASTTSMLTGRYPMDVQVFRYPDILMGEDSFRHLPGILKAYGYQTVEIGESYFVDASQLNLLDGFDVVNNRSLNRSINSALPKILGNTPSTQFITAMLGRAEERLLHIFFIRDMNHPIREVNDPTARMTDERRVQEIENLLDQVDRPLFIFAHFMDTHGPMFSASQKVFSDGDSSGEWDRDLYKDAILGFDANLEKIYRHLEETGQLENTILVVYTDHGFMYSISDRVPLLIRFPEKAYAGRRQNNLQVIDVPVTLLDYLGLEQPSWMRGRSFLDAEAPATREIISIIAGAPKKLKPPFFQIKAVQVIVCQRVYVLNVETNTFTVETVEGHTAPCDENSLPDEAEILARMLAYLESYGYDVSSLR